MIEPQNSRPGVIGEQHGLTRLTQALDALERGQLAQAERDAQIQGQLATLTQTLAQVRRTTQRLVQVLCALAVLMLAFLLVG